MRINNCNYSWQTSNGKNRNCLRRIVESGIMGADSHDSFLFLSLDTTPTGAENLRGGLHVVPVTGNDAVAAAPSLALRQFSNSSGVTKIKEN